MSLFIKLTALALLITVTVVKAGESEINIQGLTDDQESNVRAFLSLSLEPCDTPAWKIKKLFSQSDKKNC